MNEQLIDVIKEIAKLPGLVPELYGDLAKPGATQAGKALGTVIGLGNTILLPIHWVNERSRLALESNLEKYRKRLEAVPEKEITPVRPEIGVPILEKLIYVTDEELSDMYVNLLAKASCVDTAKFAHPSFVNVINNLSPDEAVLLREIHRQGDLAFLTAKRDVTVWDTTKGRSASQLMGDLLTGVEARIRLLFPDNINAYFSNLEGLGLIRIRRDWRMIQEDKYKSLETYYRPSFEESDDDGESQSLRFEKGKIEITPFGELFMDACLTKL